MEVVLEASKIIHAGTEESTDDIVKRVLVKRFQDPVNRKRYGHFHNLEMIDEELNNASNQTA